MRVENYAVVAQKGSLENSIVDFRGVAISAGVSQRFFFYFLNLTSLRDNQYKLLPWRSENFLIFPNTVKIL